MLPKRGRLDQQADDDEYKDWSEDESSSTNTSEHDWTEQFSELNTAIQQAIAELGGHVVPKLNWSCPSDATWVNPASSLACTNADEVVLMLKSSDRIAHDLELLQASASASEAPISTPATSISATAPPPAQEADILRSNTLNGASSGGISNTSIGGQEAAISMPNDAMHSSSGSSNGGSSGSGSGSSIMQPVLVLRKWYDLRPEREFRCFVKEGHLLGICQRDISQYFPQLTGETAAIATAIQSFHTRHVQFKFPLDEYTYDVYVATNNTIKVLDFNPIGGTTSPLLFEWQELGFDLASPGNDASTSHMDEGQQQTGPSQHDTDATGIDDLDSMHGPLASTGAPATALEPDDASGSSCDDSGSSNDSDTDSSETSSSGSSSGSSSEAEGSSRQSSPLMRVVQHTSGGQVGQRAACAMPVDMLMLQETVEGMVSMMQRSNT